MASLEHQWEKQLFEKFWKGTFKAVATPRPGSIIVASITARRRVISYCQHYGLMSTLWSGLGYSYCQHYGVDQRENSNECQRESRVRAKGREREREMERKRNRVRKRKIRGKETEREREKREEREKERAERERERRELSERRERAEREERERERENISGSKDGLFVCLQVLQSKPGGEVLNTTVILRHTLSNQSKGPQDYDSGNDTSSPPSTKTGISQSNVTGDKKVLCRAPASPEKLRFRDGDNVSDSGNSVTSYQTLMEFHCYHYSDPVKTSGCGAKVGRPQKTASISPLRTVASSRKRTKAISSSSSSRSRSRSSGSSRHSGRYSRSRSLSSARLMPSDIGRVRERKRDPSSCEKDVKHSSRKHNGKRQKPRSYSPMRKRRRDSPSHLEARRITRSAILFSVSRDVQSGSSLGSDWATRTFRDLSRSHSCVVLAVCLGSLSCWKVNFHPTA
uniref:Serine/arginine repetitive matrix 4 n=1 Tax=Oncorhynchus kisutch TaxID=8019 RepID=A0A8C7CZY2_ONCKI